MRPGINKVILLGTLKKDPIIKKTRKEALYARLKVKTVETWQDKSTGAINETVELHNVLAFGRYAKFCRDNLKKGDELYIEGSLKVVRYEKPKIKMDYAVVRAKKVCFPDEMQQAENHAEQSGQLSRKHRKPLEGHRAISGHGLGYKQTYKHDGGITCQE